MSVDCPLCHAPGCAPYHRDARRQYLRCPTCALVHVPAAEHLTAAAEAAQYALHRNDLADAAYRRFLGRLAAPVLAQVGPGSTGLDVGCGPAPLLARMLEEGGVVMRVFDPIYAPDAGVWAARYDLVTASEVVEHFREPGDAWARLFAAVRPGGLLAVMTKRVRDPEAFARWHYILDPTHIAFYGEDTFRWLAAHYGATLALVGDDVVTFRTPTDDNASTMTSRRP